ncbi:MAG TPA: hypothetical protein VH419_02480 [Nocardioidaceae bacterium]|jgi:hypothetical protein
MSKIHARIAAVLFALAAVFTISIGTASTADASAADCHDGVILWNYYMSIGDYATAHGLLSNLIAMGCADVELES